ncbi:MAG: HAS-barrel domain-containing protein [Anaerolineales bacterium]
MSTYEIGRLLRAGTTGFVAGCAVSQFDAPTFGALVRAPLGEGYQVYGLIYDIHIEDDGLVRQLVTAGNISAEVMRDNRERRIVPVEMSVLALGYEQDGQIFHLLPPRPPLSLDVIYACDSAELTRFSAAGHFGYFRHILRAQDAPIGELLAAHLQQAGKNNPVWREAAIREIITLLRDDYPTLMSVLGALGDIA